MATEVGEGKVAKWGGSIGIRVSAAEARALGLVPGQEVTFRVLGSEDRIDLGEVPTFRGGPAAGHDERVGQAMWRDLRAARGDDA